MTSPLTLTRRLRHGVVATDVALIALVAAWILAGGVSLGRVALAIVATLPLWLALPQLAAGNRRTCAWMTLALTPYLVLAITEAVADPKAHLWAGSCLFLALALFVMLVGYLRVTRTA